MLSVIMCAHNMERTIARSIDNLLQCEPDAEVVLVDDGSTDNTLDIMWDRAASCGRIRIVKLGMNIGLLAARVGGFRHSSGDFIAFMDADDLITNRYYTNLMAAAVATGSDICVGNAERSMVSMVPEKFDRNADPFVQYLDSEDVALTYIWNKVFRRECLDPLADLDLPVLVHAEDTVLNACIFHAARGVCTCDRGFYLQSPPARTDRPDEFGPSYEVMCGILSEFLRPDETDMILKTRKKLDRYAG